MRLAAVEHVALERAQRWTVEHRDLRGAQVAVHGLPVGALERRQQEIADSFGYQLTDHNLNMYGLCPRCR